MEINKIHVLIGWSDRNYAASNMVDLNGTVLATAKTYETVMTEFKDSLARHIEWSLADGDSLPQWLIDGNYEIIWELTPAAMLQRAESFTSLTAISKATGINLQQLGHYANGWRTPRPAMRKRIAKGIQSIASQLSSIVV